MLIFSVSANQYHVDVSKTSYTVHMFSGLKTAAVETFYHRECGIRRQLWELNLTGWNNFFLYVPRTCDGKGVLKVSEVLCYNNTHMIDSK